MGQAFYKGGFEPRMNRKEASLILSLKCVDTIQIYLDSLWRIDD